jgi:very-short-patch-repair endonuclease
MLYMTLLQDRDAALSALIGSSDGVLATEEVLKRFTYSELRWRIRTGHWQQPCKGVVVTQSGPLTDRQVLRVALGWAGPKAVLAGLTAARLDGLAGFGDKVPFAEGPIHILVPRGWKPRGALAGSHVVSHYSRLLGDEDIHPVRVPKRTRTARSIVDAAAWAPSDRLAMALVAAGVQQRVVRVRDLQDVIRRHSRLRRRQLIVAALGDIAGGAQALSELDFIRKVVRAHRLPAPTAQVVRRDESGRRRYIDVIWEKSKVVVEIDGAQHAEPIQRWDDYERDIDLQIDGYRVLRFPAWVVRKHPELVATKTRKALRLECP